MASWTKIILSRVCLLNMKHAWFSEISLKRTGLILLTKIFVNILYESFHKEIGMNLLEEVGFVFLGVRNKIFMLVPSPIVSLDLSQFNI